jgi:hypothetical protein
MDAECLALDVDDVLLDFFGGFLPYMTSRGHRVGCAPHEVMDFDMADALPDLAYDDRMSAIGDYNHSDHFASMPPSAGAVEVMASLRLIYPHLRIVAITACGDSAITRSKRVENLNRHFVIDDLVTLPLGASKVQEFRKLPPGTIYVDDMIKHVKAADDCGMSPILFRRGHNSTQGYSRVADDWWHLRDLAAGLLGRPAPHRIRA